MAQGPRQHPDTAKALKLVDAGTPVIAAARRYGLHPTTVWAALRKRKRVGEIPTKEVAETLRDAT